VVDCYVDVADQATWDTFAAAAGRVKAASSPAHLLFIGDSLTDQQRGYNYVDKLAFWLERSYGRALTYRNAGVGGDFITRVWQRMNGDPQAYRLHMYDNLFHPKPTHVFFFLGHNDSKVSSQSGYTQHCVDPETFEQQYRLAIEKVQKETAATVVVISPTSSVFEICKANADKRKAAGKAHNLFGKPEELEKFNAIARRVAAELGADYVDVYEPTRTHPDKPGLFNPNDGVHLTNAGNRLIALELLEYFGRK
jgi:lysophospholipase L1-like esterase